MTVITPEASTVSGNTKVAFLAAVAVQTAVDLSSEIGAVTTLDVSMFVRDWDPQISTNEGSAPPRLGTTAQMPVEGYSQFSAVDLRYVYDPQAATSTDDNKARLLLAQNSEHFVIVRKGIAFTTAFAVGQYYELWKVRAGRQNYVRSGTDEFAEFEIQQKLFPLLEPVVGQIVA